MNNAKREVDIFHIIQWDQYKANSLPVPYLMQWQVQWTPLQYIDLEDLEVCDIIMRIDLLLLCPEVLE